MTRQTKGISRPRRTFCTGSLSLAALGPLALGACNAGGGSSSQQNVQPAGSVQPAQPSQGVAPTPPAQSTAPAQPAPPTEPAQSTQPVSGRKFVHPGLLHTEADFIRMRDKVKAGAQPWMDGWNALLGTGRSHLNNSPRPLQTVIRGGTDSNFAQMYIDIARTYQLAVRWKVSEDKAYANKAVEFLNAWSSTLTTITGNSYRFLAAVIYGLQFANAAEIMRTYDGWAPADLKRFQEMMLKVF